MQKFSPTIKRNERTAREFMLSSGNLISGARTFPQRRNVRPLARCCQFPPQNAAIPIAMNDLEIRAGLPSSRLPQSRLRLKAFSPDS
jgi:hypothetical protein